MNHSHVLYDSDPHFKIDPISRNIIDESSKKVRLIQHDHNSERFTFEIPRYIEGHDTSSCNLVEIHYVNLEANTKVARGGVYTVDDLQVKSDDANVVVCSWLIPNNATQYVGQLQFLIRFSCVNDSTGKVEYVWNTAIYSGITVASGIYNSGAQSDNIVPPYNFVTTLDGSVLKFYVGSEEEYNKLVESGSIVPNCLYYITDEIEEPDANVTAQLEWLTEQIENYGEVLNDLQTRVNDTSEYINDVKPSYEYGAVKFTGRSVGVEVTLGGELNNAGGTANIELYTEYELSVGDRIIYNGDVGRITELPEEEGGHYRLSVLSGGNIHNECGKTIAVDLYRDAPVEKATKATLVGGEEFVKGSEDSDTASFYTFDKDEIGGTGVYLITILSYEVNTHVYKTDILTVGTGFDSTGMTGMASYDRYTQQIKVTGTNGVKRVSVRKIAEL